MRLFKETNIDFLSKRKIAFVFSLILIIVGLSVFIMRGEKNSGIDFSGGTSIRLVFQKPVSIEKIRSALTEIGLGKSIIQEVLGTQGRNIIILAKGQNVADRIKEKLSLALPDNPWDESQERINLVEPEVAQIMKKKAFWAVFLSFLTILLYITWRFEFYYGAAAIVALFHDVFITVGALALTGRPFTLAIVAALLMVVGYSINDTIVVYDRIRENLKNSPRGSFPALVNRSINQTLSRTILTSGTTLLVLIALFFFGGEVIHDFSFALLIGVIVGTYSSIFIASPLVVEWREKVKGKRR